jgi:D-lactate dehydrogenase
MANLPDQFIQALQKIFSNNNLLIDPEKCLAYSSDDGRHRAMPDAVVFADNAAHIQATIKLCNQFRIPLTARGGGTGTPGGAVPTQGGVVLSCVNMQKIKIDPDNRVMVVEPGVTNQAIQTLAAQHGFFWAPDPGSAANCTVGGNLAYNSAGPRAVKYGTPRENVLGLKAITGNGEIIRTGTYTTKGVVGYDLTRLLIGSEGTLVIITEATLKLIPLPETKRTLQALYRDMHAATQAVTRIMAQPVVPCALEFIDHTAIELLRRQGIDLPADAQALLIIEIDGLAAAMPDATAKIIQAATPTPESPPGRGLRGGLIEIKAANNEIETAQLWQARRALSPALRTLAPHKINEDVVVPVSRLPDLIAQLDRLAKQYQILIVNFGHAGNGNIHVNLMADMNDLEKRQRADACLSDVFDCVLKLGGSLSGEHGVGIEKRAFIAREIDPVTLQLMKQIKIAFDPNNILNPGKIFP